MFQTKVVEEIKRHFLCSVTFFFENCTVCDIIRKNIAERGRPQMTIWRMHIACWIPFYSHTLIIYNLYCSSTAAVVAGTRLKCFVILALPVLLVLVLTLNYEILY